MKRLALKILDLMSDARYTTGDMDSLGWHMVNESPKVVRKRLVILADSIQYHDEAINKGEHHGV